MSICLSFSSRVEARPSAGPKPRPAALFGGAALLLGALVLLYLNVGFASYALTGIFWARAEGVVTTPGTTSAPVIRFATPDGMTHSFSEDYVLLCGGRYTFCLARDFTQGEAVPVVYDPAVPQRAFIHDWALFASTVSWFIELGAAILFALMLAVAILQRPLRMGVTIDAGSRSSAPR